MIRGHPLHPSFAIRRQPQREPNWQPIGSVQAVYSRVAKELEPSRLLKVDTVTGYGIVGDRHASPNSPRQLLVAGNMVYEQFGLPEATLRENVRINFSTGELRSGDLLRLGSEVVLWMTFHCEPCHLLERRHPGTVNLIGRHRGMLARVLRGGAFGIHDEVFLSRAYLPAISDDWKVRVLAVASAVPDGQYIYYRQLAELAGVATAYCRAFPKILSSLPIEVTRRIVSAGSVLAGPQWSGAELFDVRNYFGTC